MADIKLLLDVPKPCWLKGVNPRKIMGSTWWNKKRVATYEEADWHCEACGTHVDDVLFKKKNGTVGHLEAHEMYDVDFRNGVAKFNGGVVALCHSCHSFIHADRLYRLRVAGSIGVYRYKKILKRGFDLLGNSGLRPKILPMLVWKMGVEGLSAKDSIERLVADGFRNYLTPTVPVQDWVLEFSGDTYPCKYKSRQEFEDSYLGKSGWG